MPESPPLTSLQRAQRVLTSQGRAKNDTMIYSDAELEQIAQMCDAQGTIATDAYDRFNAFTAEYHDSRKATAETEPQPSAKKSKGA